MGAWGAIIMSFFGAAFAALTIYWQLDLSGPVLALPLLPFAGIAFLAVSVLRQPGSGIAPSRQAERAIMWSSIAEGIGLFLAANIVVNIHRPELLLPAMALVVGLHFLPIAYATPFRPFYILGAALLVSAAVGFAVGAPAGGEIAGFAAALALWTASLLALGRDRRARAASRGGAAS